MTTKAECGGEAGSEERRRKDMDNRKKKVKRQRIIIIDIVMLVIILGMFLYDKAKQLVQMMLNGKNVAIITDAGTPGISDPGEEVVRQCYEAGIEVSSLPGAAACVTALTMSGQKTRRFCFEAFLPSDKKEKSTVLEELKNETRTIVIYEAPHRLVRTLKELRDALGNRSITLCRELTKKYEEADKTTIDGAIEKYNEKEPKGEFVLVIEGKSQEEIKEEKRKQWEDMSIEEHMEYYVNQGNG